ncbi:MAG: hypothetical protein GY715_19120 [Planctomycetes bacterium]|nr:hypothetical protein [Planctomycetota bacterium]
MTGRARTRVLPPLVRALICMLTLIVPVGAAIADDTAFVNPSATGDDHTQWTNGSNGYTSNGQYATEATISDDGNDANDRTSGRPGCASRSRSVRGTRRSRATGAPTRRGDRSIRFFDEGAAADV